MSKPAGQMIMDQLDALSRAAVDHQYTLQSEIWKAYGQAGYTKSVRDAAYHFSYLAESLAANHPSLFIDYIAWLKVLLAGLKFPAPVLTAMLNTSDQALQEILAPDLAAEACATVDAACAHLPLIPEALASFLEPGAPLFDLATRYLDALLHGNRHTASQLILDAVAGGVGVKDLYLYVFQPTQQEIGRLWQMNQISVAQEHLCTAATQMVMSRLYPYIFSAHPLGHRLLAASVGGELHELGVRMVADFLEMDGWDTYYLGASTPTDSILRAIAENKVEVVAISATLTLHISKVADLIERIRAASSFPPVKIMVGGYPFNIAGDLWQQVGAAGFAPNAGEAVSMAHHLLEVPA